MICKSCGTEIADKALVCYRCGRATAEPGVRPGVPAAGRSRARAVAWLVAVVWLAGGVVVWNTVFDAHITRGERTYVDRQQAFADGRGPRVDMDQVMNAAQSEGLRAAWGWTSVELAPGAALAAAVAGLEPGAAGAGRRALLDSRQRLVEHVPDNLEASRAHLVERVAGRVPGRIAPGR